MGSITNKFKWDIAHGKKNTSGHHYMSGFCNTQGSQSRGELDGVHGFPEPVDRS